MEVSGEARELLAGRGCDPVYRTRPLRRPIQRELETSRALITGDAPDGSTVSVKVENGELAVGIAEPA